MMSPIIADNYMYNNSQYIVQPLSLQRLTFRLINCNLGLYCRHRRRRRLILMSILMIKSLKTFLGSCVGVYCIV